MATDLSLDVRRAIISHLRGYAPLVALVSAQRIYGEQPPADPDWPFIRYGYALIEPYDAQGYEGSAQAITIHAFANGPYTDAVQRIAAQVVEAMKSWEPPTGTGIVACEWTGTNVLIDDPSASASKYHAAINFSVTVAG